MKRIFEADTREEANQKADEWWAKARGVRFIHRSQIPAGFRSNPSKRWVIAIHYKEEASPSLERHA
jgi:predicted RNase H-like HicB family nuclease